MSIPRELIGSELSWLDDRGGKRRRYRVGPDDAIGEAIKKWVADAQPKAGAA